MKLPMRGTAGRYGLSSWWNERDTNNVARVYAADIGGRPYWLNAGRNDSALSI